MPGPSSSTVMTTHFSGVSTSDEMAVLVSPTRTVPPGSEKEQALSIRLVTTCAKRESWPITRKSASAMAAAPRLDRELNPRAVGARRILGHRHDRSQERCDVDWARFAARKLGVEARSVGNVRDQPVESPDVVLHDRDQAIARLVGVDARQGLERAAQRGQRILQLMGDVGGEALDRVETAVQRHGHFTQRPRKVPDLVGAGREVGNLLARSNAAPHALGRCRKPPHRLGDGVGERQATARA